VNRRPVAGLVIGALGVSSVSPSSAWATPVNLPAVSAPADPNEKDWRPVILGAGVGGLVGAVAAGTGTFLVFTTSVTQAAERSGCQAEECEGYGLQYFLVTPIVTVLGATAGGVVGALGGGAIAQALTE
jgi:hypothetical protein